MDNSNNQINVPYWKTTVSRFIDSATIWIFAVDTHDCCDDVVTRVMAQFRKTWSREGSYEALICFRHHPDIHHSFYETYKVSLKAHTPEEAQKEIEKLLEPYQKV